MAKKKTKRRDRPVAETADKYDLYLRSVQSPDHEVEFFDRVYRKEFDRRPRVLREDFCGTFAVCCEWVKSHKDRVAVGVDLDPEPLGWGRAHLLSRLKDGQQERVNLLQDDVRAVRGPKADVLAAQNFSFWIFMTRGELVEYFRKARANLADEGVFILDMMGGGEVLAEDSTDERSINEKPLVDGNPRKFKYFWEQARFDPISHRCSFYIHFRFRDGSEMKRAFEYHWRLWTIPEVRELLADAGFARSDVYWEGTDPDTGEGDGVYRRRAHAPSEACWVSYIAAIKR